VNLYEITNGYIGYSYTRVYAWAPTEERALELAQDAYRKHAQEPRDYPARYWTNLECKLLFSDDAEPFATAPSDAGWEAGSP